VEQNPADALAYARLADCYVTLGHNGLVADTEVWALARANAERAIRLDSMSAEAWAALADYLSYWGRDWEEAERAFQRADELNPSLALNHYHYAWYLALFGRVEEAVVEHEKAKALDPLTPFHTTWLPALYWYSGDYGKALVEVRKLLEGDYPDDLTANYVFAKSAERLGLFDEATTAMEKVAASFPPYRSHLGQTYALAGRTEEALAILRELEALPPSSWNAFGLALINAVFGNRDEALRWLSYEPPLFSIPWALTSPELDPYRDDPRFQAVVRRMNLELGPGDLAPTPLPVVHPELPGVTGGASSPNPAARMIPGGSGDDPMGPLLPL
jgi:tetratricopeptide (TPR) repeat protein